MKRGNGTSGVVARSLPLSLTSGTDASNRRGGAYKGGTWDAQPKQAAISRYRNSRRHAPENGGEWRPCRSMAPSTLSGLGSVNRDLWRPVLDAILVSGTPSGPGESPVRPTQRMPSPYGLHARLPGSLCAAVRGQRFRSRPAATRHRYALRDPQWTQRLSGDGSKLRFESEGFGLWL